MASYTADQLYGSGAYAEPLNGTKTFQFTNPSSGSAYFILEAVSNSNGVYDSTSYKVADNSYSLPDGITGLVTSSYVAGVVVSSGVHTMSVTFSGLTPLSGSLLRSTGGVSLVIS